MVHYCKKIVWHERKYFPHIPGLSPDLKHHNQYYAIMWSHITFGLVQIVSLSPISIVEYDGFCLDPNIQEGSPDMSCSMTLDYRLRWAYSPKIRQSKINSRWVAGPMGQMNRRPSIWCSKYYFFSWFLAEFFEKILSIYLFIFLKKYKNKSKVP